MTLQLKSLVDGPYVRCDTCQGKTNLPANVAWGPKFLKPSLRKLGLKLEPPHTCKACREQPVTG